MVGTNVEAIPVSIYLDIYPSMPRALITSPHMERPFLISTEYHEVLCFVLGEFWAMAGFDELSKS